MEIIFASNNHHKLEEISSMLGDAFTLVSLEATGITGEIPEPYPTLEENALAKARYVYERTGKPCFADDTGLEVEALDGAPGVHSARFAGAGNNSMANMEKLLKLMQGKSQRQARFRTVVALIINGQEILFEGIVSGEITREPAGQGGFGYDPVFIPAGRDLTFAEMPLPEKNLISHRKRAIQKLVDYLRQLPA
jgi:XTP/dITP diphosphohydrolase